MISHIKITERGTVPRKMLTVHNKASKASWAETGVRFHSDFRELRFRADHARRAGYLRRKGEGMAFGSKAWKRSYMGQKYRRFQHQRPLEFSGTTRRAIASMPTITSTSAGVRVRYAGARAFNFKHPKSQINMAAEFRRILPEEAKSLARTYENRLQKGLNQGQ
jgi:hypothetical protein